MRVDKLVAKKVVEKVERSDRLKVDCLENSKAGQTVDLWVLKPVDSTVAPKVEQLAEQLVAM